MHAQSATAAFVQNLKIAAGLRGFDDAKSIFLIRHRQIIRIIAGYLEKDPAVWSAFIRLSGLVQESRPESQTSRYALLVADNGARLLQQLLVLVIHLDISE